MYRLIQFPSCVLSRLCFDGFKPVVLLGLVLLGAGLAHPQGTPLSTVGRIEGNDVSVQGSSSPGSDNERAGPSILVGNGSVVTVHSGQARMVLATGGEMDICGPAKFTVLQAGGAVTVALDFGRMRVQLPASATLRVFTPTIVATPIDISGGARDITVGLDLEDSLCVLASSGAIQLEHQFSGEKLIVPQTGEFYLNAGKLLPVVGKPGSCQCAAMETPPALPPSTEPSEYAMNMAPLKAPPVEPQPAASPSNMAPATPPYTEFSIPMHANEAHPTAPAERNVTTVDPPATSIPVYTAVAPPLTFSASSPLPPPEPPVDTFLLVREAQVVPNWEFKGHVDPPTFADAMQRALGEGPAPSQPPAEPQKKHGGFWGFLRRVFEGNGSQD
jgi:hypothetical protein